MKAVGAGSFFSGGCGVWEDCKEFLGENDLSEQVKAT